MGDAGNAQHDRALLDARNVILTLARIRITLATGGIRSKDTAADFVLDRLPAAHRRVQADDARAIYRGLAAPKPGTRCWTGSAATPTTRWRRSSGRRRTRDPGYRSSSRSRSSRNASRSRSANVYIMPATGRGVLRYRLNRSGSSTYAIPMQRLLVAPNPK